jgi:cysteine-rich repeat protein
VTTGGGDPSTSTAALGDTSTGAADASTSGGLPGTDTGDTTGAAASTGASDQTTGDVSSTGSAMDPCGDGILDPGELCDDGNLIAGDGCLPDCTPGTGAILPPIPLPDEGAWGRCLTTIDAALLGEPSHALVLGGSTQIPPSGGRVQRFPLPDGQLAAWTFEHPGAPFGRYVDRLATAADGDIIVAGHIYTVDQQKEGRLWLARLSPAGAVVWLREHETIPIDPVDLALLPSGDIVLAGRLAGWPLKDQPSWVQVFDAEGNLVWEHAAPASPEWLVRYSGVTVAGDGTIYVAGFGRPMGDGPRRLVVEALAADGTPLWQTEEPSPAHGNLATSGIGLTAEGVLIVAMAEEDGSLLTGGDPALAGLDTDGALLWWQSWQLPSQWEVAGGLVVAAPGGGALVAWDEGQEDIARTRVTRFNADGDTMWELQSDGQETPRDAALGPDDLLYVLEGREVRPYLP